MKIRIVKNNKYRLPVGGCIKVEKNDFPYASRLIREGVAEKISESEYAEWIASLKVKNVNKDCEGCKKKKKKCKNCN